MRTIDAVPLSEGIELHRRPTDQKHEMDRQWAVGYNARLDRALYSIAYAPTIAPPPNDPLTLEELREMDGQAVWISPVKENGKVLARWMLVSGYNPKKDIYLFAPSSNITQGYDRKSYGKTWLAYRRKPEEGETWQQ